MLLSDMVMVDDMTEEARSSRRKVLHIIAEDLRKDRARHALVVVDRNEDTACPASPTVEAKELGFVM